jgi:hypothetical protein
MQKNPLQIVSALAAAPPPADTAYLGIHPLLCMIFGVGSAREVGARLISTPLHIGGGICDLIELCVRAKGYPHDKTVWQFNDPGVELFVLRQAFNARVSQPERVAALNDILAGIEVHAQHYPYIETSFVENALEFQCEDWQSPSLDHVDAFEEDPPPESAERPNPAAAPSAFWIPTLAAGSLLIASLVAKDK